MEPDTIRSISHDMRNLLTAVRGHADLALRSLSPEDPAREDVAHVLIVTAAVFDLVDQLDGPAASEHHVAVDLDGSVMAMRRLLDAVLPPQVELVVATHADGAHVALPRLRIERIVLNLALNARDAMPDGGTLTITTGRESDDEALIIVSDTGTGFTAEAREHLFEPGFTTKRETGGSGQGLAALARFVDAGGGSIDVDSTEGEGSTISVSLPVVDPEAAIPSDRESSAQEPADRAPA